MATLTANLFLNTSGFTSGIEKARAATSNYHQEMSRAARSIQGLEGNIRVLEMQASGYDDLAASLKRTLDIEAQADRLAKSGLITREKALALLEKERLLQTNIATLKSNKAAAEAAAAQKAARMANPRAVGLPELALTPEILKQTERAGAVAQEARRKFLGLTRGIGGTSMGFLAFSQAVEDAQYGIKGVLNNIPQMILGFGGSMGLAGAISLAAVAAVTLYPHLKRLYGSLETERLKAAADAWGEIFNKGIKAAQSTYETAKAAVRLEETSSIIAQNYRQIYALGQDMGAVYSANIKKLEAERDIQEEIYEARDRLLKIQGKKDDSTIEREKAERELKAIEGKIVEKKKQQQADNDRTATAIIGKNNLTQSSEMDRSLFDEELKRLENNLAGAKANFEEAETLLKDLEKNDPKNFSDRANQSRNKGIATRMIEDIEKEISALKELNTANKKAADDQKKIYDDELNALDARHQATFDEIRSLEALRAQKQEILNLTKQTNEAEKQKSREEYDKSYDEEMAILKARAAGDEEELQRLEYKRQIQEEINELKKAGFLDDGKDNLINRAKEIVEARINAENPRKDSDGAVTQLGSAAKATNVLMGRSANAGILEENRRQTSLLRTIVANTKPKTETPTIPNFVFA